MIKFFQRNNLEKSYYIKEAYTLKIKGGKSNKRVFNSHSEIKNKDDL